jgi:WAS family protein 1
MHAARYPPNARCGDVERVFGTRETTTRDAAVDDEGAPARKMIEELLAIERQTVHREMAAEMFYASETRARARARDGLGTLPASLESLNECLLFNSDVNPYVEYALVDNLMDGDDGDDGGRGDDADEGAGAGAEFEDDWKNLAEAPKSMQDALYDSAHATQFGFRPTMGAMPSLDLPTSLPSLRYAADISWSGTTKTAAPIAPSSTATPLPDVVVTPSASAPPPPLPPTPPPPPPIPRQEAPASAPPAQLPPGANVGDGGRSALMDAIRNKDNRSRLRKRGPTSARVDVASAPPRDASMEPDLRGALMDAIRAKPMLKSSSRSESRDGDSPAAAPPAPPRQMSMMEELANSLGRRRSAIVASGDHDVREKIIETTTGRASGVVGLDDFIKAKETASRAGDADTDAVDDDDASDWDSD